MPFIAISGVPCSGKTTRSEELKLYFENLGKEVHIVSEQEQVFKAGFDKNAFYSDPTKEKHIRGLLKSEVLKLISPNNVVILDALNYIKGYRYELFCGTKANKCTQCTVHTEINRKEAWVFNEKRSEENEKYSKETFDALLLRYEEPDGKNRWDSPLFLVFPNQELDKDAIYTCLFKKKPPKPNNSTQNPPLSSSNFLYDLDRVTKEIVDELIKLKQNGGNFVDIPGCEDLQIDLTNVDPQQLAILRRQFITYSKTHVPDTKHVQRLFVQYLKTSIVD